MSLDPASTVLVLDAPYAPIAVTETVDHHTARITYAVTGRRANGVFVVFPQPNQSRAIPDRLTIRTGADDPAAPDNVFDHERADRPTLNGVTFTAQVTRSIGELDTLEHHQVSARRPTTKRRGLHLTEEVPTPTARYATAILRALLTHYASRPDLERLLRQAATLTAAERLKHLTDGKIRPLADQLDALTGQLAAHRSVAADLAALISPAAPTAERPTGRRQPLRLRRHTTHRPGRRAGSRTHRTQR